MADSFCFEVSEFSGLAAPLPEKPVLANRNQIKFITRMVMSELAELAATEMEPELVPNFLIECANEIDMPKPCKASSELERIADQQDAIADTMYYCVDWSARRGVNVGKLLNVIHAANMAKKWDDGNFHLRDDGKVLKPPGWKAPNIVSVIEKMM